MKLPLLHKGPWIYQSPRILVILAYLYSRARDWSLVAEAVKRHIEYVGRLSLSEEKGWIVERLEGLGYERKRPWAKDVKSLVSPDIASYYLEKLGIKGECLDTLVSIVEDLLSILRARDKISAVAYLPPILTLPEKIAMLECIAGSKAFDIKTSLDVVVTSWLRAINPIQLLEGEVNYKRKQFRFRYTYLISLNLIAGKRSMPRPTILGMLVRYAVETEIRASSIYAKALLDYHKMAAMLLVDVLSLDITVRSMLEHYVDLVAEVLSKFGAKNVSQKAILSMLHEDVAYLPLDVHGFVAVSILKRLNSILRVIET